MNKKFVASFAVAAGLVAGSLFMAQAQTDTKLPPKDARIDQLLEQNAQILKNQDTILKQLADIKEGVLQMRRRTS